MYRCKTAESGPTGTDRSSQRKVWSGVCTEEEMKKEAECIASQVKTDSNMRAGKEYRSRLAYVLIRRTLEALNTKGGDQ